MANPFYVWTLAERLDSADLNTIATYIISGSYDRTGGRLGNNDNIPVTLGTDQDVSITYNTTQTNPATVITTSAQSNHLLIVEEADKGTNYALAVATNPTLYIFSADAAATTDYISFTHNQTDAIINVGSGTLLFQLAGTQEAALTASQFNIATGNVFAINGTSVLSATTLGSAVVTSSLTTVGTVITGVWSSGVIMDNNDPIQIRDFGGTARNVVNWDASDDLSYGPAAGAATVQMLFNGTNFLRNNGTTTTLHNYNVELGASSATTLTVNSTITSNLIFTDNTYDIGASSATRPRNVYLSGSVLQGTWAASLVGLAYGGTNKNMTAANGGIVWTDADSMEVSAAGTSGQILRSAGASAPTWSTATFPATATTTGAYLRADGTNWITSTLVLPNAATVNQVVYASGANTYGASANLTYDGTTLRTGTLTNPRAGARLFAGHDTVEYLAVFDNASVTATHQALELGRPVVDDILYLNFINNLSTRSQIGSVTRNAGTSAVLYNTSSDARLKEGIRPTKKGLDLVMQIEVDDYTWRVDKKKRVEQGLIAQKLHPLYPEAVKVGGDDANRDAWAIDYGRVTPLILQGLKELVARVEKLEKK